MTNLLLPDVKARASAAHVDSGGVRRAREIERIGSVLAKLVAAEFLVIAATCFITALIYFIVALKEWPSATEYGIAACTIAFLVLLPAVGFKQYVAIQAQPRDRFMWSGLGAVAVAFSLFVTLLFVLKLGGSYSRGTLFAQFIAVGVALLIARGAMHAYVSRAVESGLVEARRAVLVGDTRTNTEIIKKLELFGMHWAGVVPLPAVSERPDAGIVSGSPETRNFVERCRRFKADDIIFMAAAADLARIAPIADALSELPVAVHVIPTGMNDLWASAQIGDFGGTMTVQVVRPPLSAFDLTLKRSFDVCAAGLSLLSLSPLMLLVALAIKLDSHGPVFFRQRRHGYNNDIIPVLKFRTMTVMEDGETKSTFTQATANDARLTRVGRLLRRSNIDELPQLFNVLCGEMSIIGPRPHPIALNAIFQERIAPFSRRHNVKPGITGWAQVNGLRGETDTLEKMQRRVEYDLYYIDNWSIMLDLKIVIMTLFSRTSYRNAR